MKTTFKSMMIIAAMTFCTATGFANNNATVHNNNSRITPHKECLLKHIHTSKCVVPKVVAPAPRPITSINMDRKMLKHFATGKHKFDRHGICKTCHCDAREISRIEYIMQRDIMRNQPHPASRTMGRR